MKAIEFVYDENTKKLVWQSIMGENVPMPSKEEVAATLKINVSKEHKSR